MPTNQAAGHNTILLRTHQLDPGAHQLNWSSTCPAIPTGDGLLVDSGWATSRWLPVADMIVCRAPVPGICTDVMARILLTNHNASIVVTNVDSRRWTGHSRHSHDVTTIASGTNEMCVAGWIVLLYSYTIAGKSLSAIPTHVNAVVVSQETPTATA